MLLGRVLKSEHRRAYLACCAAGFLVSLLSRPAIWGPYVGMLLTYHAFLAWLVFSSRKVISFRKEDRQRSDIGVMILTHVGCTLFLVAAKFGLTVALLEVLYSQSGVAPHAAVSLGMRLIRLIEILLVYGVSIGEIKRLFPATAKLMEPSLVPASDAGTLVAPTYFPLSGISVASTGNTGSPSSTVGTASSNSLSFASTGATANDLESDDTAWLEYLKQPFREFRKSGVSVKGEYEMWLKARTLKRSAKIARESYASGD